MEKNTPIFDRLIFNKMQAAVGGRVRFMVSGGAPLSKECAEFLRVCFGVPILQGYGLTETTAAACIGELDDPTAYTNVGPPFASSQFKLVDVPKMKYLHTDSEGPRGEIWVRGAGICKGYYKNEEKTKEDFTDGWFKTGDIGRVNKNGTLSIIDRKKNLIKPPHGEYIAVERLESSYKNSPMVDNIMVHASAEHNELLALVQPKKQALESWAKSNGVNKSWDEICDDEKAEKAVLEALNQTWKETNLRSMERISAVALFHEEWSADNGFLTAAHKINRPKIVEEHKELIEKMYKKFE
jgi:long-chain acyl-CoA synthetase